MGYKDKMKAKAKLNTCVECKKRDARYWGSNLCEECFRSYLREDIKRDDK